MKKVELFEDDVKKAYDEGDASNKSLLAKMLPKLFSKDIKDRINSIEDIFSLTKPTQEEIDFINYNGASPLIKAAAKFSLSALIVKAYNEGKLPDWDNSNQDKWTIFFDMRGGRVDVACYVSWDSDSGVGSLLSFLSEQNARDAFKKFPEAFEGWVIAKI